jgi:exodeoxyribonuclease-3
MWASPELAKQAVAHAVHEGARDWTQPSDHVPLVTEFSL